MGQRGWVSGAGNHVLGNVDWVLTEEPSCLGDLGVWEVYLTLMGSEETVLQRSEPRALAGRGICTLPLPWGTSGARETG